MTKLRPETIERVRQIDWFACCGDQMDPAEAGRAVPGAYGGVRWLDDWDAAQDVCQADEWLIAGQNASNALSGWLDAHHRDLFNQYWNSVTQQARQFVIHNVLPGVEAFRAERRLQAVIVASVRWTLVGAFQEEAYRDLDPPVRYFRELLRLYEAGHFPCGWEGGEWPEGRLLIY